MDSEKLVEKLSSEIERAVTSVTKSTLSAIKRAKKEEEDAAEVQLNAMLKAIKIGKEEKLPICQDTGIPTFYIRLGKNFSAIDEIGKLKTALFESVRKSTRDLPLRPNAVHPFTEENTGDNTGKNIPYIDWDITQGDKLKIIFLPKGGGSENMSQLRMMAPGRGLKGVKQIILDRIASMEGKPCPPTIIGVGLGGGSNIAMNLAKKAILRPIGERHEEEAVSNLESELLKKANELGVGPMGMGGKNTVLDVKIEYAHRHPGSFPVGIVPQCWANRRISVHVEQDGSIEVIE